MPEPVAIDYKTHILIGTRANGVMTVIADWPHLPRQIEVQNEIHRARDGYTTFLLCTPGRVCGRRQPRCSHLRGRRSGEWLRRLQ